MLPLYTSIRYSYFTQCWICIAIQKISIKYYAIQLLDKQDKTFKVMHKENFNYKKKLMNKYLIFMSLKYILYVQAILFLTILLIIGQGLVSIKDKFCFKKIVKKKKNIKCSISYLCNNIIIINYYYNNKINSYKHNSGEKVKINPYVQLHKKLLEIV